MSEASPAFPCDQRQAPFCEDAISDKAFALTSWIEIQIMTVHRHISPRRRLPASTIFAANPVGRASSGPPALAVAAAAMIWLARLSFGGGCTTCPPARAVAPAWMICCAKLDCGLAPQRGGGLPLLGSVDRYPSFGAGCRVGAPPSVRLINQRRSREPMRLDALGEWGGHLLPRWTGGLRSARSASATALSIALRAN